MNPLQQFIRANRLNEIDAMNYLQEINAVSDNAVLARDVAEYDCRWAVYQLEKRNHDTVGA